MWRDLIVALGVLALTAPAWATDPAERRQDAGTYDSDAPGAGKGQDADNTGRNVRDRDDRALTSGDQSENEVDLKITQQIRKAVVDNDQLSTNAQNVKIITQNGVVTLRGPVKSPEEKATIEATAKRVTGVSRVDNQLEIEVQK